MKEKRQAMGLSLRNASKLSGVSHTHIRDIEDGRSIPSFEMVMKFLKAYMVDIGRGKQEILRWNDRRKPPKAHTERGNLDTAQRNPPFA